MEQINIRKTLNFENGSIEVRYNGIETKKGIDKNNIEQLLDDFIEKHNHSNMLENVKRVRTILKDYEEKLLVIYYCDEKGSELVKYDNSHLFLFEKTKNGDAKDSIEYKIKYEPTDGIKLDYNNLGDCDASAISLLIQDMSEIMKHIHHLITARVGSLDNDSRRIIEIYKLFYNENPNFTDENINVKVQTMMSILEEFGISLGDDYAFNLWERISMPISLSLEQKVDQLSSVGSMIDIEEPIQLPNKSINTIKIVGESIREMLGENFKNEDLITLSKVIYARRYYLPLNSDIHELSKFINCSSSEVDSSIQFVKRTEQKIYKENESA